jgi:RHS repeat-associated protein
MYNPAAGRFMQMDPLGVNPAGGIANYFDVYIQYQDGLSLYQYLQNTPVIFTDPYGLWRSEHRMFTTNAFRKSIRTTMYSVNCWSKVLDLLIEANLGQDKFGSDAFKDNRRHYNRDKGVVREWYTEKPTHHKNLYDGLPTNKWNLIQDVYPIKYKETTWSWHDEPGVTPSGSAMYIKQRSGFMLKVISPEGCPCGGAMTVERGAYLLYDVAKPGSNLTYEVKYIKTGQLQPDQSPPTFPY